MILVIKKIGVNEMIVDLKSRPVNLVGDVTTKRQPLAFGPIGKITIHLSIGDLPAVLHDIHVAKSVPLLKESAVIPYNGFQKTSQKQHYDSRPKNYSDRSLFRGNVDLTFDELKFFESFSVFSLKIIEQGDHLKLDFGMLPVTLERNGNYGNIYKEGLIDIFYRKQHFMCTVLEMPNFVNQRHISLSAMQNTQYLKASLSDNLVIL
jgi:hypothetical protein